MPNSDRLDKMFSNIVKGTTEDETGKATQPVTTAERIKSSASKKEETVRATIYLRKDQHKKLKPHGCRKGCRHIRFGESCCR